MSTDEVYLEQLEGEIVKRPEKGSFLDSTFFMVIYIVLCIVTGILIGAAVGGV